MVLAVDARGPVSEADIEAVETRLGVRLPEPYRSWVAATNGGEVPLDTVIPGTDENGLISLLDRVEDLPDIGASERNVVIPDGHLVVTSGDGGCLTLKVKGDDQGSVWWADFDRAESEGIWEGPSQEIMHRLADDWNAFLAMDFES